MNQFKKRATFIFSTKDLPRLAALVSVIFLMFSFSGCGAGNGNNFALAPAPTSPIVNTIVPASGSAAGGSTVTFSGSNFQSGLTVTFGGIAGRGVMFQDSTRFTVITPSHAVGPVDLVVTLPGGEAVTITGGFTFTLAPTISSVLTSSGGSVGSTAGGTTVTITGTDFAPGATVLFGSIPAASVIVNSSTQITAVTPAHAPGRVSITIQNPDGSMVVLGNAFSFGLPPTIAGISPNSGFSTGGTVVTITGTDYQAGSTVTFGGVPATGLIISATTIQATTPAHAAGPVDVTVTSPLPDGRSATRPGSFTYILGSPTITSISPNSGSSAGGTVANITGTNFQPGSSVTIGGVAASAVIVSATLIQATTPAHATGPVDVTVTNPLPDGRSATLPGGFTYLSSAPTITSISPNSGFSAGGTVANITGTNFQPGSSVTFGGVAASGVIVSATLIQATTPAHPPGPVDVTVTNPLPDGRSATLPGGFTYLSASPTIISIVPNSGSVTGGTLVTITGTNFRAGAMVTFGVVPGTGVIVVSPTLITVTTPPHAGGIADVTIVNLDDTTVTSPGAFTFTSSVTLSIASISPATGTTAGGALITIIGSGFQTGATTTFGGVPGTGVTVTPDGTQIQVTLPAATTAAAVDVTVTNPDATTVTKTGGFTYTNPPPTIIGILPASGSTAGGALITITGTGFLTGATVNVGGVPATSVTVVSSTAVTATTPAHSAATDDITVTNADGQSATLPRSFTYLVSTFDIRTTGLAVGNPTAPYFATIIPEGGTAPFTWSITAGALPTGLSLDSATGVISGVSTLLGVSDFTVLATDSATPTARTATKALRIAVEAPPVAALPTVFIDTTFPDTAGYTVITLNTGPLWGASFQSALNSASCNPRGTEIRLAAGTDFTGNFVLPLKACAPGQWIIIRTDTPDTNLPAPDVRVDPTFSPVMAKIFSPNSSAAIATVPNANHYWFMGVEIGVIPTITTENFGVFVIGSGETSATLVPDHIYVDRCYVHGTPTAPIKRGVSPQGSFIAVVNSYLENFHVVGQDAQAIAILNAPGPIKIVNNFLEGSGNNILFGGADPQIVNLVNSDVEIRRNHFFKRLTWKQDDRSFAGVLWQVKNLLEFKNSQRVLVEGNVLENNWNQAQAGYGVLFTPRNQSGTCPMCGVFDITFRYNIYRHTSNGFNISGSDNVHPSRGTARLNIHDNLMEDIEPTNWHGAGSDGKLIQITNGSLPTLITPPTNITFNHNTSFQSGDIIFVGDNTLTNPIPNFVFTNNLQPHNKFGILGTGTGVGLGTIIPYFAAPMITNNILEGLPLGVRTTNYPPGNFFPVDFPSVRFVDLAGGDFRLLPTSPFAGFAGTDGKDIGADVSAVDSATQGVIPPTEP